MAYDQKEEQNVFGTFLKSARRKKGISIVTLSKISGVPESTIFFMEQGKPRQPKFCVVYRVAKALDMKFDKVFETLMTEHKKC